MALVDPSQAKLLRKDRGTDLTELRDYFRAKAYRSEIEFKFHTHRLWRFDLAVWSFSAGNTVKIALEVQGGIWTRGRHSRGAAMLDEWEKLNAAAELGWRVVYCQPKDVASGKAKRIIEACL